MVTITPSAQVFEWIARVYRGQVETSISELSEVLGCPENSLILERAQYVQAFCDQYGFSLSPVIEQEGDLTTPRLLSLSVAPSYPVEAVRQEVERGESERIEFKGSLMYDIERAKHDPAATPQSLRSDEVIHTALKTIAAFLNCDGGVLFVGVNDKGKLTGIECDYGLLPDGKRDLDGWQLTVRDLIRGRFHDGNSINDYVRFGFFLVDGVTIARTEVTARTRLSFLRHKGVCKLYRRQGNRTAEVPYEEIEEFIASRRATRR